MGAYPGPYSSRNPANVGAVPSPTRTFPSELLTNKSCTESTARCV